VQYNCGNKNWEVPSLILIENGRILNRWPGLPDGLFSNQRSQFGKNFQGLGLENFDIFYGHLEYFMDIWDILWPFVTFCVHLVHFSSFGIMHQEKSGNPVDGANISPICELESFDGCNEKTFSPKFRQVLGNIFQIRTCKI
jgi:hypothetical protein